MKRIVAGQVYVWQGLAYIFDHSDDTTLFIEKDLAYSYLFDDLSSSLMK